MSARLLNITMDLGENLFYLVELEGEENISLPYQYRLLLYSENPSISSADILNHPVAITIKVGSEQPRTIKGIFNIWEQLGISKEGYYIYKTTVVPEFWRLSLIQRSAIYQEITIPEIFKLLCGQHQFHHFQFNLSQIYQPKKYIVQYQENIMEFLHRILAAEGIYYYFQEIDNQTQLVLSDQGAFPPRFREKFLEKKKAIDKKECEKINLQERRLKTTLAEMAVGYGFDETKEIITHVTHKAKDYSLLRKNDHAEQRYQNESVIRDYFPAKERFKQPKIHGTQIAVVMGDQEGRPYVNQTGQVKVRFAWDQNFQNKDQSSCWIPVSQLWAGKSRGVQFMPRVGEKVYVMFINGDPDQPVIVGGAWEEDNETIYGLPTEESKQGIKTKTIGLQEAGHELTLQDARHAESIIIKSSKDYLESVARCKCVNVQHDVSKQVEQQSVLLIKQGVTWQAGSVVLKTEKSAIKIEPDMIEIRGGQIVAS